ncbi:MerR family transcriptional regulator [bacterium]|nr:MerR family transcriptional regulator [bacterium]
MKKLYFTISEVGRLTNLEPYVLRFWETQFSQLRPEKTTANVRRYRESDIELIKRISYLLYEAEYTIPGARKQLQQRRKSETELLHEVQQELTEILNILK